MEPAESRAAADDDIKRSIEALYKEADGRPVNELLARHNHERLFVRPLLWDHRQPALLQCRFLPPTQPAPPLPTATAPPDEKDWEPLELELEEELAEDFHRDRDETTAYLLLDSRYSVDLGSSDINFYYGRRSLCYVGYAPCIAQRVCFLDQVTLQAVRDRLVNGRDSSARRRSKVVSNARRRRITPPTSMPDPYIAAVFIAVAQSQRLCDEARRLWEEKVQRMWEEKVAASNGELEDDDDDEAAQWQQPDQEHVVVVVHEGEHLTVFTADVTPAFLAKLDNPREPPPPGASMDIHQQRVEFLPYDTFAARYAGAVRDTRHRCGPGNQDAGQSRSAGQEGKGSALLCSTSDIPLSLRTVEGPMEPSLAAKPCETDMKRKHSDSADQSRAGLEENRHPPNTKKRRQVHDT